MGLRQAVVGVWVALLVGINAPALAQTLRGADGGGSELRIDDFDVEQVPQLLPGSALNFSLYGTPGADASLQIDGARRLLELDEMRPGVYEGTYTIDAGDRIRPDAHVVAVLRRAGLVTRSVLQEPVQLGARLDAAGPRFAARSDPPPAPLDESPRVIAVPRALDPPVIAPSACADCAVVESITRVESPSRPGYLGAIAGGVVGAVLGNQAHRDARDVLRAIGAVGGALLGREVERLGTRRVRYDVVLRMPGGAAQVRSYDNMPPFRVGDFVRVAPVRWARAQRQVPSF